MPSRHPYQLGDEPVPGYRLVKFLGRGGFGEVWKAAAPGGASVAIKVIVNLSGAEGRKEFRALGIVKRIQHAHLVPVTAVWLKDGDGNLIDDNFASEEDRILNAPSRGIADSASETMVVPAGHTEPRSAELIIAMGLGHKSLFDRLQECRERGEDGIPPAELLDYMEQAARAIDYLNSASHELGKSLVAVQHCDIKPHNILIVGTAVQVCDFGLARVRGDVRATASTGASVAYASPECLEAEGRPSEATDQYSLGVSYHELRTGALPYRDTNFAKVMQAVLTGNLDLSRLPAAEQAVIRRATARDPKNRWPSSLAMVKALRKAVESPEPVATPSSGLGKFALAALLLLGLTAGGGWYGWKTWRDEKANSVGPANDPLPVVVSDPVSPPDNPEETTADAKSAATGEAATTTIDPVEGEPDNTPPEPDAEQLVAAAQQAVDAGDASTAAKLFSQALHLDPRRPAAFVGRGRIRIGQDDLNGAIADFEQARQIDPDRAAPPGEYAAALNARGTKLLQQEKFSDAIADFEQAEKFDMASVDAEAFARAYFERGARLQAVRSLGEADEDFSRVIDRCPELREPAYRHRAEVRLAMANADGAIADADEAIKLQPGDADAWFVRGRAKHAAKDLPGALADFRQLLQASPEFASMPAHAEPIARAFHDDGRQLLAAGEVDGAIAALGQAASLDESGRLGFKSNAELAAAYLARAKTRRRAKEFAEALADCQYVIDTQPEAAAAGYRERGECLFDQGEFTSALSDFSKAIELDPQDFQAHGSRGSLNMHLQKYPEALVDLDQAIALKGADEDRYNRALLLSMWNRLDEARKAFADFIATRSDHSDAHYQKAIVEVELHDYAEAVRDLDAARKLLIAAAKKQPPTPALQEDMGNTQALLGWVLACRREADRKTQDEAVEMTLNAAFHHSNWKTPWHIDAVAAAYASQGNWSKAVEFQAKANMTAAADDPTPLLAPSRDELMKLYQQKRRFYLPGEEPAPGPPVSPVGTRDKPADKKPFSTEAGLDEEIGAKLQKLTPKPPPK